MKKISRAIAITTMAVVPVIGMSAVPAGAKTVSPQQWATKFCTALADWEDTITDSSSDVQAALAGTSDLATGKTTLVDFLNEAIDATDSAIQDIKAAGTPRTANGAKISAALAGALEDAKTVFEDAEADAEDLPTDNAAAFSAQASAIGTRISASGAKIDSGFSEVDALDKGGKLGDVVTKTRACKFLNTSS